MNARFDLTGKVALLSGGARGLGRATACALAEQGADLFLVDLNQAGLAETQAQIQAMGRRAVVSLCDVSDPLDIERMLTQVDAEYGQVDFLANIAGDGRLGRPEEIPLADVEQTWRNLVLGRFAMCQQVGRRMLARQTGSIVNIGSIASVTALGRSHIAYSMAMGAVVQMTRELSTEWSHRGVRVNCIMPAQVLNPSLEQRMADDPRLGPRFLNGIPAGRFGHPDDLQGLMVLLASDASRWISGALLPVDGGNLAMNAGGTPGHAT